MFPGSARLDQRAANPLGDPATWTQADAQMAQLAVSWRRRRPQGDMCPGVPVKPGVVVWSVLFLALSSNPVWGNYTLKINETSSNSTTGPDIAAIVAPTVTLGVLAIVVAVLGWLFCVVKKKRQTEGTYRPSAEEQSGARGVTAPDALTLPKEERLI